MSLLARVCNSGSLFQQNVCNSWLFMDRDLVADRIIGMSAKAGSSPQGESRLVF